MTKTRFGMQNACAVSRITSQQPGTEVQQAELFNMKQHLQRFAIILGVSVILATGHGLIAGLEMPEKPKVEIPKAKPSPRPASQNDAVPADQDKEVPGESESESQPGESSEAESEVATLHEHWLGGEAVFVDARSLEDFTEGHIPGAFWVPFEAFDNGLPPVVEGFDPTVMYFVYCTGGDCHSSHHVGSMLSQLGFENVFVFEPGYPAWEEAGYEVATGGPEQ